MNINILEEKENSVLKRKEILAEVDSPDKTPTNEEIKKEFAKKFSTKESLVAVKQINQIFGKRTSKVKVNIYKDEKTLKEIEPQEKKETKKEGAPTEAPKPEAPKQEQKPEQKPKEQVPAEQKKPEEVK